MICVLAGYTDKGNRKNINQDSMLLRGVQTSEGQKAVLAVVCDGMGGFEQGEKASGEIVHLFSEWLDGEFLTLAKLEESEEFEDALFESWEMLFQKAHNSIRSYGELYGVRLGTTATVMLCVKERYYIAQVGDSKAYEILARVNQLTQDQNMANINCQIGQYLIRNGIKKHTTSILLQGIGASKEVRPIYNSGEFRGEAVYLLCSDGFQNKTNEEEMLRYFSPKEIRTKKEMKEKINKFVKSLRERGEQDDATVLLIRTINSNEN